MKDETNTQVKQVELVITIKVDQEHIRHARDASKIVSLIACDIEQGATGGFMRNSKGEEHDRWTLDINECK